jgi:hypothetical protein
MFNASAAANNYTSSLIAELNLMATNDRSTNPPSPPPSRGGELVHSGGSLPSHTSSGESGQVLAVEHASLASRVPPSLVLGTIPPDSMVLPFRSVNWAFTIPECNKHWGLDLFSLASIKFVKQAYGFIYWEELYIEIFHANRGGANFFATSGVGGWSFHRDSTPSANIIATMPTASSYSFQPGTAVRIQCPFGGLISRMVSSEPLVGRHATFYIDLNTANTHSFMPVMKDGKTTELKQPEFDPGLKIMFARLHGALRVAAPLPGALNIS